MKSTTLSIFTILSAAILTTAMAKSPSLEEKLESAISSASVGGENSGIDVVSTKERSVSALVKKLKNSDGVFDKKDVEAKPVSVDEFLVQLLSSGRWHPEFCDELKVGSDTNADCMRSIEPVLEMLRDARYELSAVSLNGDANSSDFKTATVFVVEKGSKLVTIITFNIHEEREPNLAKAWLKGVILE